MGFFAAITIEADDVEIDLGGYEIRQSRDFYLRQRFFSIIELNNRIFVENEGVASLNYQKSDQPAGGPATVDSLVTPSHVVIKNGKLGRSSHAGIHGNSVVGLSIRNIHVYDFEVAGIQCNGCKDVKIERSEVGPGAQNVPVLATFSNARFLQFFTDRLIPHGFEREPMSEELLALFQGTMSFADRPLNSVTLESVFKRNSKAVDLYQRYFSQDVDLESISDEDKAILEEAKFVFENPFGLPDGSVQYGILLNRRGLPTTVSFLIVLHYCFLIILFRLGRQLLAGRPRVSWNSHPQRQDSRFVCQPNRGPLAHDR